MSVNNSSQHQQRRTPNQSASLHSHELPLVGGEQRNVTGGLLDEKKTKKKCRGNRKAQHIRRRLRRREGNMNTNHAINDNTITHNESNRRNEEQEQQQTQNGSLSDRPDSKMKNKRKREDSSKHKDDLNVSRSLSQLSISQRHATKKNKSMPRESQSNNNELVNEQHHRQKQPTTNNTKVKKTKKKKKDEDNYNEQSLSMYPMQRFQPHYLRVSDKKFKQMLSHVMEGDAGKTTIQSLEAHEKLPFVRRMMEVTNNVHYFDLQRQLWQVYYTLNLQEESNMVTPRRRLSKSDAKQHNACHMVRFPKHAIEKRQRAIVHQLQRATNELNDHLVQLNTWTSQCQPPIDPTMLSDAITACVNKGQQRLRQEFDYKKKMLERNSNDHDLISKVYQWQPNEEQVRLAKLLWQATADELKAKEKFEILRQRIYLQRLPASLDHIIDKSMDHVQPMLTNPVLDRDQSATSASNYSKAVTQYKYDLMTLDLNTCQNIIRGHERILLGLQDQLSQTCHASLRHAIEDRQQAMRQRHDTYLKHKLETFFDDAPATVVTNE